MFRKSENSKSIRHFGFLLHSCLDLRLGSPFEVSFAGLLDLGLSLLDHCLVAVDMVLDVAVESCFGVPHASAASVFCLSPLVHKLCF